MVLIEKAFFVHQGLSHRDLELRQYPGSILRLYHHQVHIYICMYVCRTTTTTITTTTTAYTYYNHHSLYTTTDITIDVQQLLFFITIGKSPWLKLKSLCLPPAPRVDLKIHLGSQVPADKALLDSDVALLKRREELGV